jgi:phosphatidate cytidylyltransferase
MLDPIPSIYSLMIFATLSVVWGISALGRGHRPVPTAIRPLWALFLVLSVSEWVSFTAALWIVAIISFCALREYLSLVDIRLEDRWGIWAAYLSIPGMFYLIQIHWYGFFIISIPVFAFLLVPFFAALGGRSKGIVFSVGVLDFGLFFYVFCLGHFCYLIFFSERIAMLLIVAVAAADLLNRLLKPRPLAIRIPLQVMASSLLFAILAGWVAIPIHDAIILGILLPICVCMGRFTLKKMEDDLGIRADRLQPGRGRMIHALKSYLFAAPGVFHYLRWFLKWGDL